MRNLYRIILLLIVFLVFSLAFLFVSANTQAVTLAVPLAGWEWQVTLGALVVSLLALGLLAGLVVGLGLKGLRGLFGPAS